jgi:murein DD-endopeptidase MepM/ murein hydrolase activator NlpD
MQKNDKFYTFLLSHKSKSKIYIRRIEVSKSVLHFGSVGVFAIIGLAVLAIGINGIARTSVFAQVLNSQSVTTQMVAVKAEPAREIDYSRPSDSEDMSFNSGGPELSDGDEENDAEITKAVRELTLTMNPAYLPTMWAHLGKINNEFGFRRNPFGGRAYEFHAGMDIDGERGDNVLAPGSGTVVKAAYTGGYGNMIEVDHGRGLITRYGHLSRIEVKEGDVVTRGQLIGQIGSTGRSTGPHLHFEFRLNDKPINPRLFLPPEPTEIKRA